MTKSEITVTVILALLIMGIAQYAAWYLQPRLGDYGTGAAVSMGAAGALTVILISVWMRGSDNGAD